MQAIQLVLPTIATLALGTALLVPLRDDRQGRRATLGGAEPLRPDFRIVDIRDDGDVVAQATIESIAIDATSHALRDDTPSDVADETPCAILGEIHTEPPVAAPEKQSLSPASARIDSHETTVVAIRPSFVTRLRAFLAPQASPLSDNDADLESATPHVASARPPEELETSPESSAGEAGSIAIERSFAHEVSRLLGQPELPDDDPNHVEPTSAIGATFASASNREPDRPTSDGNAIAEPIVARIRTTTERAVPLTRLPLRPHAESITWPNELHPPRLACSYDERHAILGTFVRDPASIDVRICVLAIAQEDRAGRMLALRALAKTARSEASYATFVEVLRSGSDDERAFALDALATHGTPSDAVSALVDRVDAIAARAALAYVASARRADYREALAPYVDAARIESILILLAGIVE